MFIGGADGELSACCGGIHWTRINKYVAMHGFTVFAKKAKVPGGTADEGGGRATIRKVTRTAELRGGRIRPETARPVLHPGQEERQ